MSCLKWSMKRRQNVFLPLSRGFLRTVFAMTEKIKCRMLWIIYSAPPLTLQLSWKHYPPNGLQRLLIISLVTDATESRSKRHQDTYTYGCWRPQRQQVSDVCCLILALTIVVSTHSRHRQSREWTGNARLKRYDWNANSVIRAIK